MFDEIPSSLAMTSMISSVGFKPAKSTFDFVIGPDGIGSLVKYCVG